MNEGLAEYTGVKFSSASADVPVKRALLALKQAAAQSTFVRSFAYGNGPAYGLLLDGPETIGGSAFERAVISANCWLRATA